MTAVPSVTGNAGYLADPYPVRLAQPESAQKQVFSGTTRAVVESAWPPSGQSFSWTPLTVDAGSLQPDITAAGATITNFQNLNIFQDDAHGWHAVVAIGVNSAAQPDHWTVLVHAHPATAVQPNQTPLAWTADAVLSGSFTTRVDGNYDGKFFLDNGQLYLLYVKNFVPKPALRNGIVLQPMTSFTQVAPVSPTTLLLPGDYSSEFYTTTQAKLVEAPYIITVNGKYGLIYSTGAYEHVDYKAGIAWSDVLLPTGGAQYRKVLQPDPTGVWGSPTRSQVLYLLQSQQLNWPNYVAATVVGPGVASALQSPSGQWYLYFNGYDPGDLAPTATSAGTPSHRRPYFVTFKVAVPAQTSVAAATDADLATWLQVQLK